jgi:hypothetical protein
LLDVLTRSFVLFRVAKAVLLAAPVIFAAVFDAVFAEDAIGGFPHCNPKSSPLASLSLISQLWVSKTSSAGRSDANRAGERLSLSNGLRRHQLSA